MTRYERVWKLDDLNQAIEYGQDAVNVAPEGNLDRAEFLNSLRNGLGSPYERERRLDDLNQVIQ